MCLDRKSNWHKKVKVSRIGFKEFRRNDEGRLVFRYFGERVKSNTWLKAKQKDVVSSNNSRYKTGFHIYIVNNRQYKNLYGHIYKVKFRGIICSGHQNGKRVIVAKEMFVFPKQKGRNR